ncbi:MAG: universal stress protein [Bacteroidales bacterium]
MKNILVAIDFSDHSTEIISRSVEIAKAFEAKIFLVHVCDPNPFFIGSELEPQMFQIQRDEELSRKRNELQAIAKVVSKKGVEIETQLLMGVPITSILDKAEEIAAFMIIIGKESHGFFYKAFMGSTSEGVVSRSNCPVLVIPRVDEE